MLVKASFPGQVGISGGRWPLCGSFQLCTPCLGVGGEFFVAPSPPRCRSVSELWIGLPISCSGC